MFVCRRSPGKKTLEVEATKLSEEYEATKATADCDAEEAANIRTGFWKMMNPGSGDGEPKGRKRKSKDDGQEAPEHTHPPANPAPLPSKSSIQPIPAPPHFAPILIPLHNNTCLPNPIQFHIPNPSPSCHPPRLTNPMGGGGGP